MGPLIPIAVAGASKIGALAATGIGKAAIAAGTTALVSSGANALFGGNKAPKAPKLPKVPNNTGDSKKPLTGIQKQALINTAPEGLLETESVGRAKLLGN